MKWFIKNIRKYGIIYGISYAIYSATNSIDLELSAFIVNKLHDIGYVDENATIKEFRYYQTNEYKTLRKLQPILRNIIGMCEDICNKYDHHLDYRIN